MRRIKKMMLRKMVRKLKVVKKMVKGMPFNSYYSL